MKNLRKLLVLATAALMALSMVGCSSNSGSNTPATTTTTTEGGSKSFTYAIGDQPNYMDPAIASDSIGSYVINQMFFPLYYLGPDGLQPAGAEDCVVSEDGLTYTITLRDNMWSDGQPVTAEDYVYGAKHALSVGGAEASYLSWITNYIVGAEQYDGADTDSMTELGIVAVDDKTIEYHLIKPVQFFTALLWGGVYYPLRPDFAPSGDYTWADTPGYPMNGAFVPTSIDRAAKVTFERNPNWCWADKVNVDELTAVVIADQDAELMAFQTGEIDFASSVEAATVSQLPELANNFFATGIINYYIEINHRPETATNDALTDVNVRKALLNGLDRNALVEARADGVTTALYGFVPSGLVSDEGDFRDVGGAYASYDPEGAAAALAEAGYSVDNPLTLEYYYNQSSTHDLVAAVLKEQYAKIGINLELKTADVRTFFADRDENANFQICRGAMSADYSDALTYLDMATTAYQMKACWGDAKFDEMMLTASEQAGQERIDTMHAAEQYMVEDQAMVVPLFEYGSACLRADGVTGDFDNFQGNSIFWFVDVK